MSRTKGAFQALYSGDIMHNQKCAVTLLIICLSASLSTLICSNPTVAGAQAPIATCPLPTIAWNVTFGLPRYNQAHQIIQTQDGGYAVTGMYGGSLPSNATLVRYDSNGSLLWYQSYDLQLINWPINTGLLQTNDSGYVIIGNSQNLILTIVKNWCSRGNPMETNLPWA